MNNLNNKTTVPASRPTTGSTVDGENVERKLLQRIYDNLNTAGNEYGHLTSAWLDTIVYYELEEFLYPSKNK